MSAFVTWSPVQLCTYGFDLSKSWFVYFTVRNELTGEETRKQLRGGINHARTKEDRLRQGNALVLFWEDRLKRGLYNPWRPAGEETDHAPATVADALARVLELKKRALKPKSFRGYRDIHNGFTSWIVAHSYTHLRLYQFTADKARAYLDYLLLFKGYGGKTHNTHAGILHAFFSAMMAKGREWIQVNPFSGIGKLPEDRGGNLPYSLKEAAAVKEYLRVHDRRMYYAIHFLFHCFIRKTELTTVRVGDIDWINRTIRINSQAAKNRMQDSVAIPKDFLPVLLEMGLDLAPAHFYIFGKGMETCAARMTRPDDISDRYLICKKQMGYQAGDGRTFYAWKATGVIAYWAVIKDPFVIMRQARHADLQTTLIYLKSLGLRPNIQFIEASVRL